MRKLTALLVALLLPLASQAAWTQANTYHPAASETQAAASGTAPSGACGTTDGLDLANVASIVVGVAAVSGQTLSGAGNLLAYMCDTAVNLWGRAPTLDIPVTASSIRTQYTAEMVVAGGRGRRIAYVTSSVTISGGTNVVVHVMGHRKLTQP